jgi:hypothetical protein
MIRFVLTQLWNCRKANFSVFLELTLVFGLVWYIADFLFVYAFNTGIPDHHDVRHTWQVNIDLLPPGHPEYRAEENEPQALYDNYHRILRILRDYPGIEAVSMASNRSGPGSSNYRGGSYYSLSDTNRFVNAQVMDIYTGTDYFRVFHHTRDGGAGAVSVGDFEWTGMYPVVISRSMAEALFAGGNAVGERIVSNPAKKDNPFTVVGVVDDTKRFGYERTRHAIYPAMQRMDAWNREMWRLYPVIAIRSDASQPDSRFAEAFGEAMAGRLRVGNFFFKGLAPYGEVAKGTAARFGITSALNIRLYLMVFFLLNILLCVMGTFWYRVNVRTGETGIRKALGASSKSIRNVFLLEGLCLLTVAMLPAMIIELQFVHADLIETFGRTETDKIYLPDRTYLRFLITNGITWLMMVAMIVAAVWIPARRAAALPVAEALRHE